MSSSLWRLPFSSGGAATASLDSERGSRARGVRRRSGEARPGDEADASSRQACAATDAGQGGRTRQPALCGIVCARLGRLRTAGRIRRIWAKAPHRRSQRDHIGWQRLQALVDRCWPKPWIRHPLAGTAVRRQISEAAAGWFEDHVRVCAEGAGEPVSRPRSWVPDCEAINPGPATNVSTCPKTSRMLAGKRRRTM